MQLVKPLNQKSTYKSLRLYYTLLLGIKQEYELLNLLCKLTREVFSTVTGTKKVVDM